VTDPATDPIPVHVDCPRARSWMTPCVARDRSPALADDNVCVGCGHDPRALLADLAGRWPDAPAGLVEACSGADEAADRLTSAVADYLAR
jgi:hypothetical protein